MYQHIWNDVKRTWEWACILLCVNIQQQHGQKAKEGEIMETGHASADLSSLLSQHSWTTVVQSKKQI